MQKKLSILICSLESEERERTLRRLMSMLDPQRCDEIEILIHKDDGTLSIGEKRNMLMDAAVGKYIVYIDDDDLVSERYVELILKALESGPDCVGFMGRYFNAITGDVKNVVYSLTVEQSMESDTTYFRSIGHLNPVKRSIAQIVRFPERSSHEDEPYTMGLRVRLKREEYISEVPMYFYLCTKSGAERMEAYNG